ncbi:hypothetical protein J4209_01445 [Candidatus Woesearchaeota archaeon]|nr:hypothetical protein [Candidatus Woesearchaeota archaeon]
MILIANLIETIKEDEKTLAIVIRSNFNKEGLTFPTSEDAFLQLGIHNNKRGVEIKAHKHNVIKRLADITIEEIFYVQKGKISVGIYNFDNNKIKDVIIASGDLIIVYGGHSLKFLEDSKVIEVKQGPYRGKEKDKVYIDDTSM